MTNEELFKLGDYDTLYTRNLPFMHSIAKRFKNLPIETDDLVGCGDIAFMKCLDKYKPDTSKWLTYFSKLMINEILMLNRKASKHVRCISLESVLMVGSDNKEITLSQRISTEALLEDEVLNKVAVQEVLELTKRLPEKEREALRLHLLGTRQVDIGRQLGMTQAYVSRLIKKITNELYKQYEKGA